MIFIINTKSNSSQLYDLCDELIKENIAQTANMTISYQNGSVLSTSVITAA